MIQDLMGAWSVCKDRFHDERLIRLCEGYVTDETCVLLLFRDVYIWVPNLIGVFLNSLTASARLAYGEGEEEDAPVGIAAIRQRLLGTEMGKRLLEKERQYHLKRERVRKKMMPELALALSTKQPRARGPGLRQD